MHSKNITLQWIFGKMFSPVAFLMGVAYEDIEKVGTLQQRIQLLRQPLGVGRIERERQIAVQVLRVAARQLRQPNFATRIKAALDKHGLRHTVRDEVIFITTAASPKPAPSSVSAPPPEAGRLASVQPVCARERKIKSMFVFDRNIMGGRTSKGASYVK